MWRERHRSPITLKRLDLACSQNPRGEMVPEFWGRDNLRRFGKWCIFSLHPNYLLNDQILPTLGCSLLAERASIRFTSPECHSLGAPRVGQQWNTDNNDYHIQPRGPAPFEVLVAAGRS